LGGHRLHEIYNFELNQYVSHQSRSDSGAIPRSSGVVTAAFGSRKYLEMAVDLALSLREVSSLPLSILTTPEGADYLDRHYAGAFEAAISVPQLEAEHGKAKYLAAKLECLRRSPYDTSIFLDADIICVKDPSFLLEGMHDNHVRVHGRLHNSESCGSVSHHGLLISDIIARLGLDAYTYCSLAVFAFDKLGGAALANLMEAERDGWNKKTTAEFGDILYDEILLGVLGARSGVDFFRHPERAYQPLDMSFRWGGDHSFVHPGPMRNREASRILLGVAKRRLRNHDSVLPSLYWLSDILTRRAEQTGRSRRQAALLRRIVGHVLEHH
jgi:hypothetical protein